jgi:hypothetical protein
MTRDVDPAGIMSLTEYDLAVRASERTKMSREDILKLEGPGFRCEIARALGWVELVAGWKLPSGKLVQCTRDYNTQRDWSLKVLEFIAVQNDGLHVRFLDELMELTDANDNPLMGDLWRGLMATPRQICQAFLLAQEKAE